MIPGQVVLGWTLLSYCFGLAILSLTLSWQVHARTWSTEKAKPSFQWRRHRSKLFKKETSIKKVPWLWRWKTFKRSRRNNHYQLGNVVAVAAPCNSRTEAIRINKSPQKQWCVTTRVPAVYLALVVVLSVRDGLGQSRTLSTATNVVIAKHFYSCSAWIHSQRASKKEISRGPGEHRKNLAGSVMNLVADVPWRTVKYSRSPKPSYPHVL